MSTDAGPSEPIPNDSPRTSTTATALSSPTWGPPKAPLPPHRLAKIANALGVSTPVPAVHLAIPSPFRSWSESSSSDAFRRSPTPSQSPSNFSGYTSVVSKYLLHVIPPLNLPHETDDDFDLTPPPASASGYHTQFRRGTLVPLHANYQSQLGAIAKEYALPSTAGMILYLVSSAKISQKKATSDLEEPEEPGPRLSEDIWRHLWTRVLKAEQRDDNLLSPLIRSPTPSHPNRTPPAASSFLPSDTPSPSLRPLVSTTELPMNQRPITPIPPSPSTPSSVSNNSKSAPPSTSSNSNSEPETPDTSSASHSFHIEAQTRANSFNLPGLDSSSIIPILAKVEFDLDLRRAPWYDPWLRSRKMNYAKRAESSARSRSRSGNDNENGGDASDDLQEREKRKRISLLTGRPQTASPVSLVLSPAEVEIKEDDHDRQENQASPVLPAESQAEEGYEQLPEGESEGEGPLPQPAAPQAEEDYEQLLKDGAAKETVSELVASDKDDDDNSDEEFADEITARVTSLNPRKDPLADVFGSDADTWAEIQQSGSRESKRQTNPNVVELAMSAADITALPSPTQSELEFLDREIDEVQALLDQTAEANLAAANKKHVPPPLILVPGPSTRLPEPAQSPVPSTAGSTGLAYLEDSDGQMHSGNDEELGSGPEGANGRIRTPAELEKREGAVYDDIDLGLEPSEDVGFTFHIRGPEVDIIEKFDESDPNDHRHSQYLMKAQLDEIERTMAQLSPRMLSIELDDESPYSSHAPTLSPTNSANLSPGGPGAFSLSPRSLQQHSPLHNKRPSMSSPPRLALNGVAASPASKDGSRKVDPGERSPAPSDASEPIIPLSPDPFGRPSNDGPASVYWENPPTAFNSMGEYPDMGDRTHARSESRATSRFSADSDTLEEAVAAAAAQQAPSKANFAGLSAVTNFKRLWKKSSNRSSAVKETPSVPTTRTPTPTQMAQSRPSQESSQEGQGRPKTPTLGMFNPHMGPPPLRISTDLPPPSPMLGQQPFGMPPSPIPPSPQPGQPQFAIPPSPQPGQPHHYAIPPSPSPQPGQQYGVPPSPMPGQQQHLPIPNQQLPMPSPNQQLPNPFNGRSPGPSPQPIRAAQMQPSRSASAMNNLLFDQESPYPVRRAPSFPPRPVTPIAPPQGPASGPAPPLPTPPLASPGLPNPYMDPPALPAGPMPPSTSAPAILSGQAPGPGQQQQPQASNPLPAQKTRKSILKGWKGSISSASSVLASGSTPEGRGSIDKGNRPRRPSVLNFGSNGRKSGSGSGSGPSPGPGSGSGSGSISSPPPEIPPSPQIPQHFLQNETWQSTTTTTTTSQHHKSKLNSSMDWTQSAQAQPGQSPPNSAAGAGDAPPPRPSVSSRDSWESRPSIDTSQFEMVSPKMNSTLSYPYNELEQ